VVSRALCTTSCSVFVSGSSYTALPFRGACFPISCLHRSLPCRGVSSRCAASAVLNSDGSDSRAAIGRRSNKE
jgi:hypothetical protein